MYPKNTFNLSFLKATWSNTFINYPKICVLTAGTELFLHIRMSFYGLKKTNRHCRKCLIKKGGQSALHGKMLMVTNLGLLKMIKLMCILG